jgi:hypothetical protein
MTRSRPVDDGLIPNRRFAHDDRRRGLQPASAHTSATMPGWNTMAPRRVGIIPGGIPAAHGFQRRIKPLQLSHACCHRRPRKCWQTGSRRRRDGLGSASLSGSSTREHRLFYSRNATQRDSHSSHPLCRQQRSGDSEQTMRRDSRHGIAVPAPKQITSRTHRPPSVDRISASGPAVYCHALVPVETSTAVSRL